MDVHVLPLHVMIYLSALVFIPLYMSFHVYVIATPILVSIMLHRSCELLWALRFRLQVRSSLCLLLASTYLYFKLGQASRREKADINVARNSHNIKDT